MACELYIPPCIRTPADDTNPEVLEINIIELETGAGPFAHGGAYAG